MFFDKWNGAASALQLTPRPKAPLERDTNELMLDPTVMLYWRHSLFYGAAKVTAAEESVRALALHDVQENATGQDEGHAT